MDRSVAGRVGIGRPFDLLRPRYARGVATPRGARRRSGVRRRGWRRALSAIAEHLRGAWSLIGRHRRLRIGLLAVVLGLALLAGGWLWLRDSSLVRVERVQIVGVHGPEARAIDRALERAARQMSTLEVSPQLLRAAVAPYRVVRRLQASASFPHGLRISVIEQLPVAALVTAAGRTAVAADGVVLGPALLSASLPLLDGASSGQAVLPGMGHSVHGAPLLACLTVLGAAPVALARSVVRVLLGPDGVTVVMRNGLRAIFGDASRPHAKWLSLANVLADPSSAGASYVDVRVPERPAAGGGVAPAVPAVTQAAGTSVSSTASELAGDLAAALGNSSSPGASAAPATAPSPAATTAPAQGSSGAPPEAQAASATEASAPSPATGG